MKLKSITFLALFLSFNNLLSAQVKAGEAGEGFYHAIVEPPYVLKDIIFDGKMESIELDLNGDGSNNIQLVSRYTKDLAIGGPGGQNRFNYPTWASYIVNYGFVDLILNESGLLDTLKKGEIISDSDRHWRSSEPIFWGILAININNYTLYDNWKDQNEKYVGFRIRNEQDTLYGWLKLSIEGYHEITIEEFACQSEITREVKLVALSSNFISPKLFSVYPNPFDDYINISLSDDILIKKAEIISSNGQLVKSIDYPGQIIPTSDLKSGIYFLILHQQNNIVLRKKLIKI
jgi:hypothetical protein